MALPGDDYGAVNVGTTPINVAGAGNKQGRTALIWNNSSVDVYLGTDTNVTASNGMKLSSQEKLYFPLSSWERVWAMSASTAEVRVIQYGNRNF